MRAPRPPWKWLGPPAVAGATVPGGRIFRAGAGNACRTVLRSVVGGFGRRRGRRPVQLVAKRPDADPEKRGGARPVFPGRLERLGDQDFFGTVEAQRRQENAVVWRARAVGRSVRRGRGFRALAVLRQAVPERLRV